jgi:hypothetical protein
MIMKTITYHRMASVTPFNPLSSQQMPNICQISVTFT